MTPSFPELPLRKTWVFGAFAAVLVSCGAAERGHEEDDDNRAVSYRRLSGRFQLLPRCVIDAFENKQTIEAELISSI